MFGWVWGEGFIRLPWTYLFLNQESPSAMKGCSIWTVFFPDPDDVKSNVLDGTIVLG